MAKEAAPKKPLPLEAPSVFIPTCVRGSQAWNVYLSSKGGATRSYLCQLEKKGQIGRIAAQLFRAQKSSARAKRYRGGLEHVSYTDLAYERKGECLQRLCELLSEDACGMRWGWQHDPTASFCARRALH